MQRLLLAIALANDPRVGIDEPTTGLDQAGGGTISGT